jgi:NitT/TauT family transport system substrate-binding protein
VPPRADARIPIEQEIEPVSFKSFARRALLWCGVAALALANLSANALAQEIKVTRQYGLPYLPLMVMEHDHLFEKHLKALGAGDAKVTWATMSTTTATVDGLLSGSVDFASSGITGLLAMWDKTQGTRNEIRAISGISSFPYPLVSSNPSVRTLKDFTEKDRIAVPAVKISVQAIVLQMAAAQAFGADKRTALDAFTVSMGHPTAAVAVMSGKSEVNAHFSYPPYSQEELRTPGVHAVVWANDVTHGPATTIEVVTPGRVMNEHPKWVDAWLGAQREASDFINQHHREAAQTYIAMTNEKKLTADDLVKILADPQVRISVTPYNTMVFAKYMNEVGSIKHLPASWKDYFWPVSQGLDGS